jgi:hypothetical protein
MLTLRGPVDAELAAIYRQGHPELLSAPEVLDGLPRRDERRMRAIGELREAALDPRETEPRV